jgi:ABC-type amino acid transport substrate-binding protein
MCRWIPASPRQTSALKSSAHYYREEYVLFYDRKALPELQSVDDPADRVLAAERGSGAAAVLFSARAGSLRENVRLVPNGIEAAKKVVAGEAAAAFVTRAQAEAVIGGVEAVRKSTGIKPWAFGSLPQPAW